MIGANCQFSFQKIQIKSVSFKLLTANRENVEDNVSHESDERKSDVKLTDHDLVIDNVTGPQQKSPRDCLPKTQVCANTKVDVYGLTPARCRKVKEICSRSELKPR